MAASPAAKIPAHPGENLAPHKALYDIRMVRKKSGSQVINISGQMFYKWHPGCEAWNTDHRFRLNYEYADAPPLMISSDFTTYEDFSGDDFSFTSRRSRNGKLYEELRGHADMKEDGSGTVSYTMPEGKTMDLPAGTIFPIAHSIEMLKQAAAKKGFYNAVLFDGSDMEGPFEVSSFIGAGVPTADIIKGGGKIDPALLDSPARKVRMAFFPLMDNAGAADYEMDAVMHDNGVISDMTVEYGDFTVSQKLKALQKVAAEDCPQDKSGNKDGR